MVLPGCDQGLHVATQYLLHLVVWNKGAVGAHNFKGLAVGHVVLGDRIVSAP